MDGKCDRRSSRRGSASRESAKQIKDHVFEVAEAILDVIAEIQR